MTLLSSWGFSAVEVAIEGRGYMGGVDGRKKNLGLEVQEANIFPNAAQASFFLAFEAAGLLFRKDF
jgi:hypothetical protein